MKYFNFLAFLMVIFTSQYANAETYMVNTSVLNIRSCPGTSCDVIGKLTQGELIYSEQDNGEWIEVPTDTGSGFVIKKSLQKYDLISSIIGPKAHILLIVLGLLFLIFLILVYFLPSRVAKGNKNAEKIRTVNLFLGWIPIVWLVLLLAALIGESKES